MIARAVNVLRWLGHLLPPPRSDAGATGEANLDPEQAGPDADAAPLWLPRWTLEPTNRQPAAIRYYSSSTAVGSTRRGGTGAA